MGAEAEINEQLQMMLELRDNQNDIASMLNEAELVRSQLYELLMNLAMSPHWRFVTYPKVHLHANRILC